MDPYFLYWGFCPWGFCHRPMGLLCIGAFLCPPTRLHEQNWDFPYLYHVLDLTLSVRGSLFSGLRLFVRCVFFVCLWGFCPVGILSIGAFLCSSTWSHEQNEDCIHLYHVCNHMNRMGTVQLEYWRIPIVWIGILSVVVFVLGTFVLWGFCQLDFFLSPHVITWTEWGLSTWSVRGSLFSGFGFWPLGILSLGLLPYGAFVHWAFLCPSHDHMYRMVIVHTCITYVITWTDGGLSALSVIGSFIFCILAFVCWGFCPFWLLSIRVLLCPPHDHMNRIWIVHTCITYVITWTYRWGIVRLECYRIFIFCISAFVCWGFCPFWLLSIGAFLCPQRDRMNRMGIVHTCITWVLSLVKMSM